MEINVPVTPLIKVSPPEDVADIPHIPAEEHAYIPEQETTSPPPQQKKTVGNMETDEFVELMVKAIIQAEKVKEALAEEPQEEENRGPVGKVLGTIGDVAHGIVDIAEGGLRGAIDIITVGKAKRK